MDGAPPANGTRLARLFVARVARRDGPLADVAAAEVAAADVGPEGADLEVSAGRDADPTVHGRLAYALARQRDEVADGRRREGKVDGRRGEEEVDGRRGERVAEVYVHPDRARLELLAGQARAAAVARTLHLRVRPKAVRPPRTIVFLEDDAAARRGVRVLEAALTADDEESG